MKWIRLTALSVLLSLPTLAANELSPAARQEVETHSFSFLLEPAERVAV